MLYSQNSRQGVFQPFIVRIGLFDACHVLCSMGWQEGEAGKQVQKEMS